MEVRASTFPCADAPEGQGGGTTWLEMTQALDSCPPVLRRWEEAAPICSGAPVKGIQSGHQTFTSQFIYFSKSMVVSRASRVRGFDLGFFVFSKLKCSWECQASRALEQKTVSSPAKSKVDQACARGLHTVSRGLH